MIDDLQYVLASFDSVQSAIGLLSVQGIYEIVDWINDYIQCISVECDYFPRPNFKGDRFVRMQFHNRL